VARSQLETQSEPFFLLRLIASCRLSKAPLGSD
jgi:hypothetical protein